jgi:hypothetical protein
MGIRTQIGTGSPRRFSAGSNRMAQPVCTALESSASIPVLTDSRTSRGTPFSGTNAQTSAPPRASTAHCTACRV